jgi:4'-phosphopantetheinyl transferase
MSGDMASVGWLSAGMSHVPVDDDWVDAELAGRLGRMRYTKRRSEARLGRWTAKVAIAMTLGLALDSSTLRTIVVRNAPDGAPEAYVNGEALDGVIAMTDRADWAVCAVAPGRMRVGCDLELVEPRSPAFVSDYLTTAEQDIVARSAEVDVITNAIWSAKESALKVLRTGLRRDTRTVEVSLSGLAAGSWEPLQVRDDTGRAFPGWWIRYGDFVLTCTAEQPVEPPVSLEDPPALDGAIPSHGWMDQMWL